jgi:hypothetical protein
LGGEAGLCTSSWCRLVPLAVCNDRRIICTVPEPTQRRNPQTRTGFTQDSVAVFFTQRHKLRERRIDFDNLLPFARPFRSFLPKQQLFVHSPFIPASWGAALGDTTHLAVDDADLLSCGSFSGACRFNSGKQLRALRCIRVHLARSGASSCHILLIVVSCHCGSDAQTLQGIAKIAVVVN